VNLTDRNHQDRDIQTIRGYGGRVSSEDRGKDGSEAEGGPERRSAERIDVMWSVDCETDDTFLYASIANISELGIFVTTRDPLEVGTLLTLRFSPPGHPPFVLRGVVQWVNAVRALAVCPNPGMGVRFVELTQDDRDRLIEAIHTIAYVPYSTSN
jgi:type IV pilus assembly protein PilZ